MHLHPVKPLIRNSSHLVHCCTNLAQIKLEQPSSTQSTLTHQADTDGRNWCQLLVAATDGRNWWLLLVAATDVLQLVAAIGGCTIPVDGVCMQTAAQVDHQFEQPLGTGPELSSSLTTGLDYLQRTHSPHALRTHALPAHAIRTHSPPTHALRTPCTP